MERLFLVHGDSWREKVSGQTEVVEGYTTGGAASLIRVESNCNRATVTSRFGENADQAFEYEIPVTEAEHILRNVCRKPLIRKTRSVLKGSSGSWLVDEYTGGHQGLVVARWVAPSQPPLKDKPEWLGPEITGDELFRNVSSSPPPSEPKNKSRQEARYELSRHENLADDFRRILEEQIVQAAEQLSVRGGLPHEGVHEARKALKKSRSALRLMRPALGSAYRESDQQFRDLGRSLSELRDADALLQSCERLAHDAAPTPARGIKRLDEVLDQRRQEIELRFMENRTIHKAREQLLALRSAPAAWRSSHPDEIAISSALLRSVRRARRAFHIAAAGGAPEDYHEWRKRVKDLRYQCALLRKLWPDVFDGYSKAAKDLEQALGEDHNLAVLHDVIDQAKEIPPKERRHLLDLLNKEQSKLRAQAHELGTKLHAEKPRWWRKRLDACWRVWNH